MCTGCVTSGLPEAVGIAAIGARAWWVCYTNRRDQRRWPTLAADLEELDAVDSPADLAEPATEPADRPPERTGHRRANAGTVDSG